MATNKPPISIDSDDWIGLQERLETVALKETLKSAGLTESASWSKSVSAEDAGPAVGAHLARVFSEMVLGLREAKKDTWLSVLQEFSRALEQAGEPLQPLSKQIPLPPFKYLLEILDASSKQIGVASTPRPNSPLSVSALLTGSGRSPSLHSQILKELASAERADWLVSFIKWSGIRPLRAALQRYTDTANSDGSPRLRIATTSYLGATDLKAIEFLLNLPNTELRVSYDTHRTRLHAKAYLFHRRTGFGSGYVGSANVSRAALDEGLEWTAKIAEHELQHLWRQLLAAFETHWQDPSEFEPLTPDELPRLARSLDIERSGKTIAGPSAAYTFFELRPYGFQQEIIDAIDAERRAGLHRHLVIAATGTGKTLVAAFDYREICRQQSDKERPSLLFVCHREEILRHARDAFRHVLRDGEFGDLVVGGSVATQTRHLFCTVQSWHSRDLQQLQADHFDYIVFDEAHHAAATSYQAILNHIQPQTLLGLTATPERNDGGDIRDDFGGRFTHEIRLPDAIERRLLVPFHYFGVADEASIDLSKLQWQRGGYGTSDLNKLFGANEARAYLVLKQTREILSAPEHCRGLGFCVSKQHAHFMAQFFSRHDLPSVALTADSKTEQRHSVQTDLKQQHIHFIFTVDLYNEGIDIPEIDTVLLLRPTESLTVYLQQLGRGLRLHPDKGHLTVIDFIAAQHRQFRYANRFRALSSDPGQRIDKQVKDGFAWLPSGCLIDLERQASEHILANIRSQLGQTKPQLVKALVEHRQRHAALPDNLQTLLDWLHLDEPDDLLRHGLPSRLWQAAGGPACDVLQPFEKALTTGLRRLATTTDTSLLGALVARLDTPQPGIELEDTHLLLAYSLLCSGKNRPGNGSLTEVDHFIRGNDALRADLLRVAQHRLEHITPASGRYFKETTGVLELHGQYTREQILLACGKGSFEKPHQQREGVLHLPDRSADLFFVTISKGESEFSPTTMYEDYALSESRFHWQSQSNTSPESPTGQRYIHHRAKDSTPMLFVRDAKTLSNRLTAPFHFCGPLRYLSHQGSKPMSIVWELEQPMPARILRFSRRDAA